VLLDLEMNDTWPVGKRRKFGDVLSLGHHGRKKLDGRSE